MGFDFEHARSVANTAEVFRHHYGDGNLGLIFRSDSIFNTGEHSCIQNPCTRPASQLYIS